MMGRYTLLYIIGTLLTFLPPTAAAQRTRAVEGHALIYQTDDMTPAEARAKVIRQAQIDALNREFGSNVTQSNITILENEAAASNVKFYMLGESDLRGVWEKNLEEPKVTPRYEDGHWIWEATVKGRARELTRATVNFEWQLLRGGMEEQYALNKDRLELYDGDVFYLRFRSPVSGYLQVFLADGAEGEDAKVTCAVPGEDTDGYCRVVRNQWSLHHYNPDHPDQKWFATLPEDKQMELDHLYVIFSPHKISPPVTETPADNADLGDYQVPGTNVFFHIPEISFENFQKYLAKLQKRDSEVQVVHELVKIVKRK